MYVRITGESLYLAYLGRCVVRSRRIVSIIGFEDQMFVLKQLMEKCIEKKHLYITFIDLENYCAGRNYGRFYDCGLRRILMEVKNSI